MTVPKQCAHYTFKSQSLSKGAAALLTLAKCQADETKHHVVGNASNNASTRRFMSIIFKNDRQILQLCIVEPFHADTCACCLKVASDS